MNKKDKNIDWIRPKEICVNMGLGQMSESCLEHSCADCLMFNWNDYPSVAELKCPCYDCSHGWKRGVKGAECKHSMDYNIARIERNKRFIARYKHVLDER